MAATKRKRRSASPTCTKGRMEVLDSRENSDPTSTSLSKVKPPTKALPFGVGPAGQMPCRRLSASLMHDSRRLELNCDPPMLGAHSCLTRPAHEMAQAGSGA